MAFKPRKKTEIKAKRMRKNVRMRRQGSLHHKEHSEHNEHYIYIPGRGGGAPKKVIWLGDTDIPGYVALNLHSLP